MESSDILIYAFRVLGFSVLFMAFGISFIGLKMYSKLPAYFRMITLYFVLGTVNELIMWFIMKVLEQDNHYMHQFYSVGEYIIISLLYYKYLLADKRKVLFKLFALATPVILLLHAMSLQSVNELKEYDNYGTVAVYGVIVFCSAYFLYRQLADPLKSLNRELITINILIFCYYIVRLIIFSSVNFLFNQDNSVTLYFWLVFALTVVAFYSALGMLLWKHGRSRKLLSFSWR